MLGAIIKVKSILLFKTEYEATNSFYSCLSIVVSFLKNIQVLSLTNTLPKNPNLKPIQLTSPESAAMEADGAPGPPERESLASDDSEDEEIRLPLASYFVLTLSYCAIGSLVFTAWEKVMVKCLRCE